jgi:hypothetical protein
MSTMKDYSDQEWKAISGAPTAAGLFITLADASGPVGIAKEAMAVSRAISETKSPAEAKPFKMWLASIAAKVSQASKEGGFLGIGGTPVSRDEENALRQLSEALGMA